ncbi:MAG: HAMP domain-containing histidine kinase [Bacteroidales bacterium]|nr:HAMP domain-containing histidine kinase [Bacteroidales bacterium]
MLKKRIIILTVFALVSIASLLVLQLYWINNAIKVREKNFDTDVNDAVNSVIYQMEKIETAQNLRKRSNLFPPIDSLFFNSIDSMEKYLKQYYHYFPDSVNLDSRVDKFFKKKFILNDILDNLFNYKHFNLIEERVNSKLLDILLKKELVNRDITTEYEYGIYSPRRNVIVMQKTGNYTKQLSNTPFRFTLYPGDMFMPREYLLVYFPNRTTFILTRMWGMLIVSLLLAAAFTIIFAYNIYTIIKQKKVSEMKSDLINNLTHEFKTPISTISLACETLKDSEILKSEGLVHSYLNIINQENSRLGTMAEKVLQAGIMEKGHLALHKEIISLHKIINDVAAKVALLIEKKNGSLKLSLNAENDRIKGDKIHLTNTFHNLLDNAVKYSQDNPCISITTHNVENGILIAISDKGIGICKKDQLKIFDNLFRVHTGNIHNVKGYGLGLGYVKTVVLKHKGNISVDSELKKGATFSIFLPFY